MLQRIDNNIYCQDGYGDGDEQNNDSHYFGKYPKSQPVIIDGISLEGYQWHHQNHLDLDQIKAFNFKKPIYQQYFEAYSIWCPQFGWQQYQLIWMPKSLIRAFHVIKGLGNSDDPRADHKIRNHQFSLFKP